MVRLCTSPLCPEECGADGRDWRGVRATCSLLPFSFFFTSVHPTDVRLPFLAPPHSYVACLPHTLPGFGLAAPRAAEELSWQSRISAKGPGPRRAGRGFLPFPTRRRVRLAGTHLVAVAAAPKRERGRESLTRNIYMQAKWGRKARPGQAKQAPLNGMGKGAGTWGNAHTLACMHPSKGARAWVAGGGILPFFRALSLSLCASCLCRR